MFYIKPGGREMSMDMNLDTLTKESEMEPVNGLSGVRKSLEPRYGSQHVKIEMNINSYIMLFGMPLMFTFIILGSVGLGAYCLNRSVVIPNLTISPPHIDAKLHVPPPIINNSVKPPDVTVNVPPSNVLVKPEMPASHVTVMMPDNAKGQVQVVEKVIEKKVEVRVEVPVPIYVETRDQAAVTIQDIYPLCEKYVDEYFAKLGKDPKTEQVRWLEGWRSRVAEIGDEQRAANDIIITKRGAFKVDSAKVEEIIEVCRIMLRYRDAKLAIPTVFKEAMTADNLYKLKVFLAKGPSTLPRQQ